MHGSYGYKFLLDLGRGTELSTLWYDDGEALATTLEDRGEWLGEGLGYIEIYIYIQNAYVCVIEYAIEHLRLHMNYYIRMFYQMSQWHTLCVDHLLFFVWISCIYSAFDIYRMNARRISCVYNVSLCTCVIYSYSSQSCIPKIIHACHKSIHITHHCVYLYTPTCIPKLMHSIVTSTKVSGT